jgi:hypothetical protein
MLIEMLTMLSKSSYVARGTNAMLRISVILLALCMPSLAAAAEYDCKVRKKVDSEATYSAYQIEKGQFAVQIEESGGDAFVSRCSFSQSGNEVTCDRYQVDKFVFDQNAKIKKYYVFRSQFDVQLFSDLSFIENNGRGGIAYGKCRVVAP